MPNVHNITNDTQQASDWLKTGKILVYPSESVWGMGCNAFDMQAVHHLLELKNRPIEKGLIVLTSSQALIQDFLKILPNDRRQAVLASWVNIKNNQRQASTWLFPIPKSLPKPIPDWITGGRDTLAIRPIRHHTVALLCADLSVDLACNNPYGFLVSTSCNPSSAMPAQNLAQAYGYFGEYKEVAFLQGETLGYTLPSQIRHALTGELVRE